MNFLLSPPKELHAPGLAPNDATMVFPIAGVFLALAYFVNQQRALVGNYLANSDRAVEPVLAASVPLRYVDVNDGLVLYRGVTDALARRRELAVMDLFRLVARQGDRFAGAFTEATGGPDDPWLKKYVIESIFDRECPETRWLPLGFLLVDGAGARSDGAVARLTLEINADILKVAEVEKPTFRLYGSLVDTDWQNVGQGLPPRRFFMFSQAGSTEGRRVDAAVLDAAYEQGGRAVSGVGSLALELFDAPVDLSTDVRRQVLTRGLALDHNSADSPRLVYDAGMDTFYLARAFSYAFPVTSRFSLGRMSAQLELAGGEGELLLVVDGSATKRVSMLSFTSAAGDFPADALTSTVGLKGLIIDTQDGLSYYQNTPGGEWSVRGGALAPGTRLDLLAVSAPMQQAAPAARAQFDDFLPRRYRDPVTLSLETYERAHADQPRLSVDTPEVRESAAALNTSLKKLATYAVAGALGLVGLAAWVFPAPQLAYRVGQITAIAATAYALFLVLAFVSVRFEVLPELLVLHDDIVYYFTLLIVVLGAVSVALALRFNERVPSGLYIMLAIMVITMFLMRSTTIENTRQLTVEMKNWRSALITVSFKSATLFAFEAFKMCVRARNTQTLPAASVAPTDPSFALLVLLLVSVPPLYRMLLSLDSQECELGQLKAAWMARQPATERVRRYYEAEAARLPECPDGLVDVSNRWIGVAATALVFGSYISAPLFSLAGARLFPARVREFTGVLEDSRVRFWWGAVKVLVSFALLSLNVQFLLPAMNFNESPVCLRARASVAAFKAERGTDLDRALVDLPSKFRQIDNRMDALGCSSEQLSSVVVVGALLLFVWLASVVTPARFATAHARASMLDALAFFFVVFVCTVVVIWTLDEQNMQAVIDGNAKAFANRVATLFVP